MQHSKTAGMGKAEVNPVFLVSSHNPATIRSDAEMGFAAEAGTQTPLPSCVYVLE